MQNMRMRPRMKIWTIYPYPYRQEAYGVDGDVDGDGAGRVYRRQQQRLAMGIMGDVDESSRARKYKVPRATGKDLRWYRQGSLGCGVWGNEGVIAVQLEKLQNYYVNTAALELNKSERECKGWYSAVQAASES